MDLKEKVEDLNSMILQGQILEAFEKHYHPEVVMIDNQGSYSGKETNRKREQEWLSGVTAFNNAEVKAVAVGDGVTMVEWHFDYQHKELGHAKYDQVAVQRWKDGQIIHERFFVF
ncbi:MAG TPA: nuclear transport factor 2 family protein [Acidobacteriota bacterium]|nr:nuclear transport factor 2 family protein [Acidobacteriota bacterium]